MYAKSTLILCILVFVALLPLAGCGGGDKKATERQQQELRRKQIEEAKDLAARLRKEEPADLRQQLLERVRTMDNICKLQPEYTFIDLGREPDFFWNGTGATYSSKSTDIYVREFRGSLPRTKVARGRHPSFALDKKDIKLIYEKFVLKPNSWDGVVHGIEIAWPYKDKEPILITDDPGTYPYFVDNDRAIVYQIKDEYFYLDEKFNRKKISREKYQELLDKRQKSAACMWKLQDEYNGIRGVWLASADDAYHLLAWPLSSVQILRQIPERCWIYFWSEEDDRGLLKMKPIALPDYTIKADGPIQVGDRFDIYAPRISPLTKENIGYFKEKWKGTLQVSEVGEGEAKATYVTRLSQEVILGNDIAVHATNPDITYTIGPVK